MKRLMLRNGWTILLLIGLVASLAGPFPVVAQIPHEVNAIPVAEDMTVTVEEDSFVSFRINATDDDGDSLTYQIVDGPDYGAMSGSLPNVTYRPTTNYYGVDTFTFIANDGENDSNIATVTINVTPTGDPPEAFPDFYETGLNAQLVVAAASGVLANDTDPDNSTLSAILVSSISNGVLVLRSDGGFTYKPAKDYSGVDSFTYMASDGLFVSNITSVTIGVNLPDNTPPVALSETYTAQFNTTLVITETYGVLANDTDAEGDPLTAQLVGSTAFGTLVFNGNGSFEYAPNTGYVGADHFVYRAYDDEMAASSPVMVTIHVNAEGNTAPKAVSDTYTTPTGGTLTVDAAEGVLANDTDAEEDALTAQLVGGTAFGTLTLNSDGSFVYQPNNGFTGTDRFVYQAYDGYVTSLPVMVTINVTSLINHAPVAVADSYTMAPGSILSVDAASGVLANDSDEDGDTLTAQLVAGVSHGSLSLSASGSFTFTPTTNYTGVDTFTYRASDGQVTSGPVTVTIHINASLLNHLYLPTVTR